MDEVTAYIGLGSNIGDRQAALMEAVQQISTARGIQVIKQSAVVETKPIGPIQNQPDFLNSVLEIKTSLSALELLDVLLSVEQNFGRVRAERWGPRRIDLDILLYGHDDIDHPRLRVPHPEIAHRAFVRSGLAELGAPL